MNLKRENKEKVKKVILNDRRKSKIKIKFGTYKNLRNPDIQNNVDIVFLDVASSVLSGEDKHILARYISPLNTDYNKNQWVVKFG